MRATHEKMQLHSGSKVMPHSLQAVEQRFGHVANCRGRRDLLPVTSTLRCSYQASNTPFLRLAPLKMEQLSHDPYLVLYHDVLHARERNDLLLLSRPHLRRALVGAGRLAAERRALHAPVAANATWYVERLHRRIEDISGLDLRYSKPLAVIKYDIGGHYYLHYDCKMQREEVSTRDEG